MSKQLTPEEINRIQEMSELYDEERFYELLMVHPKATTEDIRLAYYNLSRQWHPDRFFNRELGDFDQKIERVFMGITKAYRTLSTPHERVHFDRTHITNTSSGKDIKSVQNKARYRKGPRRRKRERDNPARDRAERKIKKFTKC